MQRRQLLQLTGATLATATLAPFMVNAGGKISKALATDQPIKCNFNENALGMSPKARDAIKNTLDIGFRYPDDQRAELITALAKKYMLEENFISLGNGSSENIQAIVQSQIIQAQKAGQAVQLVVPNPTFNYAELYAQAMNIPVVKVELTPEFTFDVAKLKQAAKNFNGVTIFYLCNPNNPTSTIIPAESLFTWIKKAPINHFFVIDEAYAEFVTDKQFESAVKLVKEGIKNLAVTRTFSKLYALAGYRIGYLIAQPEIVVTAESLMALDNTNLAGAVAALASLQDPTFATLSVKTIEASRQIVQNALIELGLKYVPSNGNFIFHEIKGDVKTYQQRMKEMNIYVGREFLPIQGWNRLTLGTPEEMEMFVNVLKLFREKGWV
ncbi:MAG TPA: aminotransferase class I [Pasteurellaceae bacterium]|nr:aminotransferase class I [Pasteurellaceae bacterium]